MELSLLRILPLGLVFCATARMCHWCTSGPSHSWTVSQRFIALRRSGQPEKTSNFDLFLFYFHKQVAFEAVCIKRFMTYMHINLFWGKVKNTVENKHLFIFPRKRVFNTFLFWMINKPDQTFSCLIKSQHRCRLIPTPGQIYLWPSKLNFESYHLHLKVKALSISYLLKDFLLKWSEILLKYCDHISFSSIFTFLNIEEYKS